MPTRRCSVQFLHPSMPQLWSLSRFAHAGRCNWSVLLKFHFQLHVKNPFVGAGEAEYATRLLLFLPT
jgi:hypothetical protein